MPGRQEVLNALAPYEGNVKLLRGRQTTRTLIDDLSHYHRVDRGQYDLIYHFFLEDTLEETCEAVYCFIKENVNYVEEGEEAQTVRTPAAIIETGYTWGSDCKNFSLFAGGVIDAISRNVAPVPWCYRFAGYSDGNEIEHVFVVVCPGGEDEIWIDATLNEPFNSKAVKPVFYKDKKMPTYRISGARIGDSTADQAGNVVVDVTTGDWVAAIGDALSFMSNIFPGHSNWYKADESLADEDWEAVSKAYKLFYSTPSYNTGSAGRTGFKGDLGGLIDTDVCSTYGAVPRYTILNTVYKNGNDPQILQLYYAAVANGLIPADPSIPLINTVTSTTPGGAVSAAFQSPLIWAAGAGLVLLVIMKKK